MHYVMVDGVLTKATPEAKRWLHRASKGIPGASTEPQPEPVVDLTDHRSDYQIIESLDESE